MNFEHDSRSLGNFQRKDMLKQLHHKAHGGKVIVIKDNSVLAWKLYFLALFGHLGCVCLSHIHLSAYLITIGLFIQAHNISLYTVDTVFMLPTKITSSENHPRLLSPCFQWQGPTFCSVGFWTAE